ncbi:unnamed protein product [Fraxinus pennsylvanica]|uniref:Uncharacterized protein n=1 Tax=Fraxinus pennsylvanica TaxID=56036 RepID=A0AAD1YN61_9LAMI|nr:unnamed protein product [Fraxinus pennsylvanica]
MNGEEDKVGYDRVGEVNGWHSAGTFDVCSRIGGPFRTMRFPAELVEPTMALTLLLGSCSLSGSNSLYFLMLISISWLGLLLLKLLEDLKFHSILEGRVFNYEESALSINIKAYNTVNS